MKREGALLEAQSEAGVLRDKVVRTEAKMVAVEASAAGGRCSGSRPCVTPC